MPDNEKIERVAIFAKLSDGSVKEVFIPEKDQRAIIASLYKTYSPLRLVPTDYRDSSITLFKK